MELLQEWYMQETKDSEEEKFHRPIGEERLFLMLSAMETLNLSVGIVSKKVRRNRWGGHPFPGSYSKYKIPLRDYYRICHAALYRFRYGNGTSFPLKRFLHPKT